MADDSIEIEYQLTPEEHIQFLLEYASPSTKKRKISLLLVRNFLLVVLGSVSLILFSSLMRNDSYSQAYYDVYNIFGSKEAIILLLILLPFSLVTLLLDKLTDVSCRLSTKNRLLKAFKKGDAADSLLKTQLILSSTGVKISSNTGSSEVFWPVVEKVDIVQSYLCVWVKGRPFVYIPSRFFKSDDELKRIFEQAKSWFLSTKKDERQQ